jgi:hypothetical protein
MSSAKEKQLYLQAIWMFHTVPAVRTARGGAGGRPGSGKAGPAAAAAAAAAFATRGRGGVRTSSGEAGADALDMFVDQKESN